MGDSGSRGLDGILGAVSGPREAFKLREFEYLSNVRVEFVSAGLRPSK